MNTARSLRLACCALLFLPACTTVSTLKSSTLAQGHTSTDIVTQMVLDNLAMALKEPKKVLPWHVKITQGSIGITDTVTPSATFAWAPTTRTLELSGSRAWAVTWTIVPELDPTKLNDLQDLYYNKTHPLDASLASGTTAPSGTQHGEYNGQYVWVSDTERFSGLVQQVLNKAPVTPDERGVQLPVPSFAR